MKKLILVGMVVPLALTPAFVLAQTTGGGTSGSGITGGGITGGSTTGGGATGSDIRKPNTPSGTPGSAPSGGVGTSTPSVSDKPITQADCQRLGGTWIEGQTKCIVMFR
jgi:hypothetical protein